MTEFELLNDELRQICRELDIDVQGAFRFRSKGLIEVDRAKEVDWKSGKFELFADRSGMQSATESVTENKIDKYDALVETLQNVLYEQAYMRHFPAEVFPYADQLENGKLTPLFLQANDNQDGWDPGWQVYQTGSDGRLFVQKGDRSRAVIAGEYSTYQWPGVAPKPGDLLSVRKFSGSAEVQPSFYFAFGSTLSDQFDEFSLLRFYFHVRVHAAVSLMAGITARLNEYAIPFRYKSLVQADAYTRADAAVLYVAKRYYQIVASIVLELANEIGDGLRDGTPLFTKKIATGIAIAENPISGGSFGMHRCGLVARGIVRAWSSGTQDVESRMASIAQAFVEEGLDMEKPYLNPKSFDLVEQPIFLKESLW